MTRLLAALRQATADLDELGQHWALIGGLAVSVRAEPRTTRDIDLVVAVRDDNQAEGLVRDLRARSYVFWSTSNRMPPAAWRPSGSAALDSTKRAALLGGAGIPSVEEVPNDGTQCGKSPEFLLFSTSLSAGSFLECGEFLLLSAP